MVQVLLVFVADIFQQVRIELYVLQELDGPGSSICLWVVDGEFDFQSSVVRPTETLCHLGGLRDRITGDIRPCILPETNGLHDQGVAVPLSRRISLERRLRIYRQGAPVG